MGPQTLSKLATTFTCLQDDSLLELLILRQVEPYIDSCLPDVMHGFRNNKSTETALVSVLDQIKDLKSRNKKVAILALDCSSAFDLLDHNLVTSSLERIGAGPKRKVFSLQDKNLLYNGWR